MEIRYSCKHVVHYTIHKDGLEYINVRYKCNDCRRIKLRPMFVTVVVGIHTLVIPKRLDR